MKKILMVSCTLAAKENKQDLKIYDSLRLLKNDVKTKIHFNNKEPLPKIYNQYINKDTLKNRRSCSPRLRQRKSAETETDVIFFGCLQRAAETESF